MITITKNIKSTHGFSLLELVIVILLIGIVGISLTKVSQLSISSYIDGKDRNQLGQSIKWLTDRISREVREALPQSIRTGSSANIHCVEFMPIVNASYYLNLPQTGTITSFDAVAYDITFSNGLIAAIMPIDSSDVYNVTGVLANVASISTTAGQATINLTTATSFNRRSPQNRFYLLNNPVAFCLNDNNGEITRYNGHPITAAQAFPPVGGSSSLIGENFTANGTVFNYQLGTLSRASLLQINLTTQNRNRNLAANTESINVFHEVQLRNVP
jgi:MSHA biogenesis protein MshO